MSILDDFKSTVEELPDNKTFGYEKGLSQFVLKHEDITAKNVLEDILKDKHVADTLKLAAFVALCSRSRRYKNYAEYSDLLRDNKKFKDCALYTHMKILYELNTFNRTKMNWLLETAEKNVSRLEDHAGVLSAFSDVVVTAFEYADLHGYKTPEQKWLIAGIQAVDKAITMETEYGKFYYIKARLLTVEGKFDEAAGLIQQAIDLENSGEADYSLRISEYLRHLEHIHIKTTSKTIMDSMQKGFSDKIQSTLMKNLEYIGLFAAIMSFTIGSLNIVTRMSENSLLGAGGLIIILMGSLLCVFSGFSVVLHGKEKWIRCISVFGVGILTILGGVMLVTYIQPIHIWNTNSEIVKACFSIINTIVSGV